jgi:iron complex outermembrane receptor protein
VRGYELQASVPFDIIHESLDGFGIVASATFMDGKLDDGGRVPGLSNEIYTLTAYYEFKGFEFRLSGTKRDDFQTETRGLSLRLDPVVDRGGELWDAQIGYDFSESGIEALDGLRVTLQAQNLTDEKTIQTNGSDARQITQFQSFGRNYMLGLNYKF